MKAGKTQNGGGDTTHKTTHKVDALIGDLTKVMESGGGKSRSHRTARRHSAPLGKKQSKKHSKKHSKKPSKKPKRGERISKRGGSVVGIAALPFGLLALQKFFQTRRGRKDLKKISKTVRKSVRKVRRAI